MMHIKRFDEKKKAEPTEEVGQEMPFDSASIDSTPVGFKSQLELPSDADLAEIKKKIKGTEVVGLGKIKKFEDFEVSVEVCPCEVCECEPCECAEACCPCCECEPCECPAGCPGCDCAE